MLKTCSISILASLVALMPALLAASEAELAPHSALSAEQVVEIQLSALKSNDQPHKNAGIAVAYRFASPSNRQITGPLERFSAMVSSGPYRFLLDHRRVLIGPPDEDERQARIPVVVVATDGQERAFMFFLSRQPDAACGCWLTDSVIPVKARETQSPII